MTTSIWQEPPAPDIISGAWLGVAAHTITVTAEVGGYSGSLKIQCHNPEGAPCRLGCPNETCEDTCYCDQDLADVGRCLAKEWIELEDPWELYGGATDAEVSSGAPVLVRWDGDGWVWALEPSEATP